MFSLLVPFLNWVLNGIVVLLSQTCLGLIFAMIIVYETVFGIINFCRRL